MLDLARIVGFDSEEDNARKSSDKHGVSQAEAEQVFTNMPLGILEDLAHSQIGTSFQALGQNQAMAGRCTSRLLSARRPRKYASFPRAI